MTVRAVVVCVLLVVSMTASCQAADEFIRMAHDLQRASTLSRERKIPIVVFVSQQSCHYCAALRTKVLLPMLQGKEFDDKGILREVSLDPGKSFEGFDGLDISGREFAGKYDAAITPTLLFLDSAGNEVADRIVGISNLEYYGFYLDRAMGNAMSNIAAPR